MSRIICEIEPLVEGIHTPSLLFLVEQAKRDLQEYLDDCDYDDDLDANDIALESWSKLSHSIDRDGKGYMNFDDLDMIDDNFNVSGHFEKGNP